MKERSAKAVPASGPRIKCGPGPKIKDLIKFYAFLTNLSIQYIGVMKSDLKPDIFHTYMQN